MHFLSFKDIIWILIISKKSNNLYYFSIPLIGSGEAVRLKKNRFQKSPETLPLNNSQPNSISCDCPYIPYRSWRGVRRRMWWGTTSSPSEPPASWPRPRRPRRLWVSSKVPAHANRFRQEFAWLGGFFLPPFILFFNSRCTFVASLLSSSLLFM